MSKTVSCLADDPSLIERTHVDQGRLEIWRFAPDQHALYAGQSFEAKAVLCAFSALTRLERPNRHSVQVSETEHIVLSPTFLQFINHSCNPNVAFDVTRWELVALRPIAVGDEVRYFYPSTEWLMTCPFECDCSEPGCLGEIRGAAFLPAKHPVRALISPHIRRLLARHSVSSAAAPAETA